MNKRQIKKLAPVLGLDISSGQDYSTVVRGGRHKNGVLEITSISTDFCVDCGCDEGAHITDRAAKIAGAKLCLAHIKCKGFKPYPRDAKGRVYEP